MIYRNGTNKNYKLVIEFPQPNTQLKSVSVLPQGTINKSKTRLRYENPLSDSTMNKQKHNS